MLAEPAKERAAIIALCCFTSTYLEPGVAPLKPIQLGSITTHAEYGLQRMRCDSTPTQPLRHRLDTQNVLLQCSIG